MEHVCRGGERESRLDLRVESRDGADQCLQFIDEQLPTNELGATRIEVKAAAFERAKALYDLEYERETIALIQSTYLMSYRLGCLNDVKGPWYWIGVAINLAYTAGLHRLPPPDSPDSPAGNSRLWIQLFWSVYCRDVWLCLAYSRPVRILLSEVTTPIPTRVQFASAPVEVPDDIYHRYLPYEINELARLWLCLVRISATLGSVLSSFYTAKSSGPTRQQIDYMEHEIEAHLADLPAGSHRSELVMIHVHQIRLYHEYATNPPPPPHSPLHDAVYHSVYTCLTESLPQSNNSHPVHPPEP